MKSATLRFWFTFLGVMALVGLAAALRLSGLDHMEFKYDEKYMFLAVQYALDSGAWPALGMQSGASVRNPGMSVWVFNALGWVSQARDPVALTAMVGWLGTAALALLGFFIWRKIPMAAQAPWWWALAFAAVNPLLVAYQRKLWAQSVLAFFVVLFLWAYWERRRAAGSFFWGLIGPCLGQIHMSGFFFAAAFALMSARSASERKRVRWIYWFAGSVVGSLPMLPWLFYLPVAPSVATGFGWLGEFAKLRFWSFWFSDPTGLTLGYLLGVHRGGGPWGQNADFMRYPLLPGGTASYGVAVALAVSLAIALGVFAAAAYRVSWQQWHRKKADYHADTHYAIWTAGGLYGAIVPFSMAQVRRHYLLVTFPLEFVWFSREALRGLGKVARPALAVLWLMQLLTTLSFLQYVQRNRGAPDGDYGESYRSQLERGALGLPEVDFVVREVMYY